MSEDTKTPPELMVCPSLDGDMNIVFQREDSIFHVIAKAPGGAAFTVGNHFETCQICKDHGVTFEQFHRFMRKEHS